MAHYKKRKPKKYKGCCSMCSCKTLDMGVAHKRRPSIQELRAEIKRYDVLLDEIERVKDL